MCLAASVSHAVAPGAAASPVEDRVGLNHVVHHVGLRDLLGAEGLRGGCRGQETVAEEHQIMLAASACTGLQPP